MDSVLLNTSCESSSLNRKDFLTEQSVGKHDNTAVTKGFTSKHQIEMQLVEKLDPSFNDKNRKPRSISKPKILIRSHAIREAASPPLSREYVLETEELNGTNYPNDTNDPCTTCPINDLTTSECTKNTAESLTCSSPSLSSYLKTEISTKSSSKNETYEKYLSERYTDNTGINLQDFIVETLHRNYKDRTTLLKIEQEMIELIKSERTHHKFSSMSSYHRMLVHRVAAFFGLEHNVDQTGNCVVVSKSFRTRLPPNEIGFKTWIQENIILPEEPINKKMNLKREVLSLDEFNGRELQRRLAQNRSKSCEENPTFSARVPISNRNPYVQSQFPVVARTIQNKYPAVSSAASSRGARPRQFDSAQCSTLHKDLQPYNFNGSDWHFLPSSNRIPKVESFDSRELHHGYDDGFRSLLVRPMKSYSFGGYVPSNYENILATEYDRHKKNEIYNSEIDAVSSEISTSSNVSRLSLISSGYKSRYSQSSFNSSSLDEFLEPHDSYVASISSIYESFPPIVTESNEIDQSVVVPEIVNLSIGDSTLPIPTVMAVPLGGILLNPQTGQSFYGYEANQHSRCDLLHPQSTFYGPFNYSLPAPALPFSSYNTDFLLPFPGTGTEFTNPQTYSYYLSPSPSVENRTMAQKNIVMPTASSNQGYFRYQSNLLPRSTISENTSCLTTSATFVNDSNNQPVFQIFERNESTESRGLNSYVGPITVFTPTEQPPCRSVAPTGSNYNDADLRFTRTSAMLHHQQSVPVSSAGSCDQKPRLQRQKTLFSASHLGQPHPNIHGKNQRIMTTRTPVINAAFPNSTS